MPTSTNIAKYPEGMLDILEAVCETRKPATIPYALKSEALSARLKFYGLVRALVINKHSLAPYASRLTFQIDQIRGETTSVLTVKFAPVSEDNLYKTIAAKLMESKDV